MVQRAGFSNIFKKWGEFPGGRVVRIPGFHCLGSGSVPGQGTEIPQAVQHSKKKKERKREKKEVGL